MLLTMVCRELIKLRQILNAIKHHMFLTGFAEENEMSCKG